MSALRRVTAPPLHLAEAVTNSLRRENFLQDVSHPTVGFFREPPLALRRGRQRLTQRICFEAVISASSPILSGVPL